MNQERLYINNIPAIILGEKTNNVFIFVHGKLGCKEEAEQFANIVCKYGYQVLAIDLPGHGERKDEMDLFVPWIVEEELKTVFEYVNARWNRVSVRANSIGAYFSMLAFKDLNIVQCLFVSPIVDMTKLISDMMDWAKVTKEELKEKGKIPTEFGETLNWDYYTFANDNKIEVWNKETSILYADKDNLTNMETILAFVKKNNCKLTIMENGEHWFHTKEQLEVLDNWIEKEIK